MERLAAITERELKHATAYIVRAIDERFGGNQSVAARAFGCDPSTLNKIRNGSRKPVTIVSGVANALGVSVDAVLGRRPVPTARDNDSSIGQTAVNTEVERMRRYPTREEAIDRIAEDPEWQAYERFELERGADTLARALDSDEDPGFGFWFDGIRDQLKLWRRAKKRAVLASLHRGPRPADGALRCRLTSIEDPGFGFWFDGIRDQLKLWHRAKKRAALASLHRRLCPANSTQDHPSAVIAETNFVDAPRSSSARHSS